MGATALIGQKVGGGCSPVILRGDWPVAAGGCPDWPSGFWQVPEDGPAGYKVCGSGSWLAHRAAGSSESGWRERQARVSG